MKKNWMELLNETTQLQKLMETNEMSARFGLVLTEEDAKLMVVERKGTLKEERRVEFGGGITPKLIEAFCDSSYISQDNYVETLLRLQEIFYRYKNEMTDEITDDELIHFMREQFESVCSGDLDYLAGTCLEIFAQAVRAGYQEYHVTDGYGNFEEFDIAQRWDHELYMQALQDLF